MITRLTLAAAALTALSAPAAAATAFDLEGVASGFYSVLSVVDTGVTMTVTPEGFPNGSVFVGNPGVALLGGSAAIGSQLPNGLSSGQFAPLRFAFDQTVDSITFNFGDAGGDNDSPVTISAYSAGNTLLGSVVSVYPAGLSTGNSATLNFAGASYFITTSMPGSNNDSLFWDISAIEFNAVPEPQSWMLMILGFGAVGAAVRKRMPAAGAALA